MADGESTNDKGLENLLGMVGNRVQQQGELTGRLIEVTQVYLELKAKEAETARLKTEEAARLEAEKAKPASAQTLIVPPEQTPLGTTSYAVRDMWRTLEALVQQVQKSGNSARGDENYRDRVFKLISDAASQIYPGLGNSIWKPTDHGDYGTGWSHDNLYLCMTCNAVQIKATKERITTPAEYALIRNALSLGRIAINEDTSNCNVKIIKSAEGESYQTPSGIEAHAGGTPTVAGDADKKTGIEPTNSVISIDDLMKAIGGEWYVGSDKGSWNSLYLFCISSGKAYSRETGKEAKIKAHLGGTEREIGTKEVSSFFALSLKENMCSTSPYYKKIEPDLPEGAKLKVPNYCSACEPRLSPPRK